MKIMESAKNYFKANLLLRRQDYDKDGRQDCIGVTNNFIYIMDHQSFWFYLIAAVSDFKPSQE